MFDLELCVAFKKKKKKCLYIFFCRDVEIIEVDCDNSETTEKESTNGQIPTDTTFQAEGETSRSSDNNQPTSSALQLNQCSVLSQEDPVKMMDSILNESGTISQNINLLGK